MELEQRYRNSHMTYFFVVMFIFNMAANFVHPVTPTILKDLNLSDYMFGVAFASMMFCQFIFSPFWGKINNYLSSRKVILICGMIYAVAQVFFGLARTEIQFVLARMLAGIGCSGAYLCFLTYVINCSPLDKRGRNLTINATAQSVSSAFGYLVGGMIGEFNVYWSVWLQVAVLALTSVLFYVRMCDDATEDIRTVNVKSLAKSCNPFSAFMQMGRFMTGLMAVLFIYYGLATLGFIAFDQCFNYYIRDQFGFTPSYNGIIKAALGVISLVANSLVAMFLWNRNKRRDIAAYIVPVLCACCLSMLGVVLVDQIVPFVLVNVVFFAFYYVSLPMVQDIVAELGRDSDSNLIMGSFNSIKSFGSIFGALFAGLIYEINPKLPFTFGFVAFAVATVFAWIYRQMEKKQKAQ